jgi:hypothetical protein
MAPRLTEWPIPGVSAITEIRGSPVWGSDGSHALSASRAPSRPAGHRSSTTFSTRFEEWVELSHGKIHAEVAPQEEAGGYG